MKFDLTCEQALELGRAAHLVTEYLPVTQNKQKALADAQKAIYRQLGIERHLAERNQATSSCEKEIRAMVYYTYGGDYTDENLAFRAPDVTIEAYYDRLSEDVTVKLSFDLGTFLVEAEEPEPSYYRERAYYMERGEWLKTPFPDVLRFNFPVWYGSKVQLTISTPTGLKEATYLFTKKGVIAESQTIDVDNVCTMV